MHLDIVNPAKQCTLKFIALEIVCNCYVITKLLLFVIVLVTYLRQIIAPCFKKPGLFYREVEALGSEKEQRKGFY